MKATQKQVAIMTTITTNLDWAVDCNDIDSMSIECEIGTDLNNLNMEEDVNIDPGDIDKLEEAIYEILRIVRKNR